MRKHAFSLVALCLAFLPGCYLGGDCDWRCHNRDHHHHGYRAPGPEAAPKAETAKE